MRISNLQYVWLSSPCLCCRSSFARQTQSCDNQGEVSERSLIANDSNELTMKATDMELMQEQVGRGN